MYLRLTITLFFLLSGATGLIYQVLWVRMLALVLGHSVLAISLVQANLIASRFVLVFVVWCVITASHGPSEAELS